ncbi:Retrovirus-related Pol polyprotein from transposon TNT 1-94 [Vitis vinifera]|uniref:Retrovirus-related Pol polyprotein from transposon TNT 1-94 n=1 Tax=Vitis vinifera TaxID=29760 RepID=A0A438J2T7_VITVI|nr:Retrovirus-related Pol polyprotein from transposon TNT 1-94 [Vitis vinifera]
MIQTQFSSKLRVLRFDNGGEYVNQCFRTYFKHHGLVHETSCPQTPQQNGIAERKHRHILETARALLHEMHVPPHYWSDAESTAVHLLNRLPFKVLNFKTPLQVLASHVSLPTTLMLSPRVFGCVAYVHLPKNQRTKLDPCARRCLFLGYIGETRDEEHKWLHFDWPNSETMVDEAPSLVSIDPTRLDGPTE